MTRVAVTGAEGFIGRNLREALAHSEVTPAAITRQTPRDERRSILRGVDVVVHLAGVNRPDDPREFRRVNFGATRELVDTLLDGGTRPRLLFSSSTRAVDDTEYGRSKRAAESEIERYGSAGGEAVVYRLPNVFGKWCRPDYNSVVATFCHNVANGLAIDVHDASATLELVHVSHVVQELLEAATVASRGAGVRFDTVGPTFDTTVGHLADLVRSFPAIREAGLLPDLSDPLTRLLHSTYLSHIPDDELQYPLVERTDDRGRLAELIRGDQFGQIFVSTTRPGVVRGDHSHRVKVEKFVVLSGEGVVRIRRAGGEGVRAYEASGARWSVVDIPPGTVHNIENVGDDEMIVLFWAAEVFDADAPDTWTGRV